MVVLSVAACDKKSADAQLVRTCGDYVVEANFAEDGSQMNAVINGDAVVLNISESASGAKYDGVLNDTSVTMWGKGDDWTMILDDDMVISCVEK